MSIISEFRNRIVIDSTNSTLDIDSGTVVTIAESTYADLQAVAAALVAALDIAVAGKKDWAMAYNSSGTSRGKWTLACDSGSTYILDDNSKALTTLFGWTTLPTGAATTHTSDIESNQIFTPQYALAESLEAMPGGYEADNDDQDAEQMLSMNGTPHTVLLGVSSWVRSVTPVLLDISDVKWLRRWWKVVKDGRKFKFMQDRTVTTAYDEESNAWGYHFAVLDLQSIKSRSQQRWSNSNTFTGAFLFRWHP